jgi:hypothetical protein
VPQLRNLGVQFVSLVDRAAVRNPENPTEPQRFLVYKRDNQGGDMPTTEELTAELQKMEDARDEMEKAAREATEKLEKAETERAELAARVEKLEKGDEPAEPKVDLAKADPAIRAALEKAESDRQAMAERLEKAEKATEEADKLAKAERDARVTREFITKAEGLKGLSQEPAKFGPVLKSAAEKLTKDEADELDRVLKAADEQIRASLLFKEQGHGGQTPPADSALAEVQRKAEELKKADGTLTDSQAFAKAMESDKALEQRYLDEVR